MLSQGKHWCSSDNARGPPAGCAVARHHSWDSPEPYHPHLLQALALAQRQQPQLAAPPPQPKPEVQVIERVVETVDAVTQYKLERIEAETRQLMQEREAMQRYDIGHLQCLAGGLSPGCKSIPYFPKARCHSYDRSKPQLT